VFKIKKSVVPYLEIKIVIAKNIKIDPINVKIAINPLARTLRSREPPRKIIKYIGAKVISKNTKNQNTSATIKEPINPNCIKNINDIASEAPYLPYK